VIATAQDPKQVVRGRITGYPWLYLSFETFPIAEYAGARGYLTEWAPSRGWSCQCGTSTLDHFPGIAVARFAGVGFGSAGESRRRLQVKE